MGHNEITAEKINIKSLFSDKYWFLIPEYQRSYVWDTDNINDLLDDLWYAFENRSDSEYFLGSLVLKRTDEQDFSEYEVLDGQQRLTTFMIMMAVLRDVTNDVDLKDACKMSIFQKKNVPLRIPKRKRIVYKIRDNVEDFINNYIIENDGTKKVYNSNNVEKKNVSIYHMFDAISTITTYFQGKSHDNICNFGGYLLNNPVFIYVSTENREDAFRMFTILNNRGIPLTNADILKSLNIGEIADKNERNNHAKKWETVEGDLEDFDRFLSFVRTLLIKEKARLSLLDEFEDNIYKKGLLKKGKDTIDYISNVKRNYDDTIKPDDDSTLDNEYKNLLTIMDIGLPSGEWIPPLLAFYDKFGKTKLVDFLKKLEYKFSSDWILQYTPTKRIENMNNILKEIAKSPKPEDTLNCSKLFEVNATKLKYILDEDVYGRRFARYILLKYEYLQSENIVRLSGYNTISVEHILPQNPRDDSQWKTIFSEKDRDDWTHKLANLILISKRKNSKLSNLDYHEKKERYLKGRVDIFPSSKLYLTSDKWNIENLINRQDDMLNKLIE